MPSQFTVRTSLFIIAIALALCTLASAVLALQVREQLTNEATAKRAEITAFDKELQGLQQDKAYSDASTEAKALAASIEKKQKEEEKKASQAAQNSAKNANVPTVNTNDNCSKANAHSDATRIDVIVNKKHCIQPLNFAPKTSSVSCAGNGTAIIATVAISDFKALCQAASDANVPLGITSSYRSYETQITTYNYWVAQGGRSAADRYSARPGYSEHQTGLSVDFSAGDSSLDGFTGTPQQKWMAKNAYKYGWVQRYTAVNSATTGYNAESWHYRYIGRAAASRYVAANASSLESFWNISGGDY